MVAGSVLTCSKEQVSCGRQINTPLTLFLLVIEAKNYLYAPFYIFTLRNREFFLQNVFVFRVIFRIRKDNLAKQH